MANLVIAAAINIALGLAVNALFPPPDIQQEGPRLAELGFTSAAYGKFVNIVFGTDRVDGNIIDTEDPAIEEVVTEDTQSVGKGGGQKVTTTTYTYFFTGRIAFCIEGADGLLRLWGDGKIIYDVTGTGQVSREGLELTFYPGGVNQLQDPEEVSRRGSDIPAYRHLTTIKLDRMPLADFGNRIPNMTAEITFNANDNIPFIGMQEPAGLDVPGALGGGDTSYMKYDRDRNYLASLKNGGGTASAWIANGSDLTFLESVIPGGFSEPTYGFGYMFTQTGGTNAAPLQKWDAETGILVETFGEAGLGLVDDADSFGNNGRWETLSAAVPGVGVAEFVIHLNGAGGSTGNGSVMDANAFNFGVVKTFSDTVDGFPAQPLGTGVFIPDNDRGIGYLFIRNTSSGLYELHRIDPNVTVALLGGLAYRFTVSLVRTFTNGATTDDFTGTGAPAGWALNRSNGDLMICNGTSIVLYNPITDTILAKRESGDLQGRNNFYTGSVFAYGTSSSSVGNIEVIDTRDLSLLKAIDSDDIPWQGGDAQFHDQSLVWDDRTHALFLSRVDPGSNATNPNRILKVYIGRIDSLGVGLDTVVSALSTTYQRQTMAGLDAADIDVTTLAGQSLLGYTINRKSTMRAALEPLRLRFQFDALQSDWIMKFPLRGATPLLTIPEEQIGILKRGRDQTDEPAVQEIRTDDLGLPMALAVRYKNKDANYQSDYERDKRHLFPDPTMRSKSEQTVDVPIVDVPTNMKQLAQKQLLTVWNERVSYKTILPWTYMALDSTDVFNIGVFGETAQVRMVENDLGAGWAIGMTGVVEDTKQYSSTLSGGTNLGNLTDGVPSSLPTRLIPLNAPLLDAQDFLFSTLFNAYMAVGAFESFWPGATVMKSTDSIAFTPTGTSNTEAVVAKVKVPPGDWNIVDGDFPNRIQEIAEGGTMVVNGIRRSDFWASTTETNMLAGSNSIAVIGADDEVEIVGFVDAVDNGDNTYTLTRLLRGRLGTEDIADGGMFAGDDVIGLRSSTGVKEIGPILRQRFNLSELNVTEFFKGVTIGTLIEDNPTISHAYTGRDIKPYAPADVTFAPGTPDGLDVTWQRRSRGPFTAEWLDGSGIVPLNETIEQYKVVLSVPNNIDFLTKTVDDTNTVNVTQAEIDAGNGGIFQPILNHNAEFGDTTGWTLETGTNFDAVVQDLAPIEGDFYFSALNSNGWRATQDTLIDPAFLTEIDTGTVPYTFTWQQGSANGADNGPGFCEVIFLNGAGGEISRNTATNITPALFAWVLRTLTGSVPALTRTIQVVMESTDATGTNSNCYLDDLKLNLEVTTTVPDELSVSVSQVSEINAIESAKTTKIVPKDT